MIDLFMTRGTIRKFKKDKVEKEKIDSIIQGALTSPSGRNDRPWELILIDDSQVLEKISTFKGKESAYLRDIPLAIAVLGDEDKTNLWIEDSSIISGVIQLMAHSLGLGSFWNHIKDVTYKGQEVEPYIKDILKIPNPYRLMSIIAIGYPDEEIPRKHKVDLDYSLVHREKYQE